MTICVVDKNVIFLVAIIKDLITLDLVIKKNHL